MPELQIFGRRWHVSTDILPVITSLLSVVHFVFVAPFLAGTYTIESTGIKYNCNVGSSLRAAAYGMFALYIVSALLEGSITAIGLKGGPLEESKRRPIRKLLYAEVVVWFLLLGWTSYGTYILKSPKVMSECWDDDPCAYSDELPAVCVGKGAERELTPACQTIMKNANEFGDCYSQWIADALSLAELMESDNSTDAYGYNCNDINEMAGAWINSDTLPNITINIPQGDGNTTVGLDSGELLNVKNWASNLQTIILNETNIPYDVSRPATSVPWFECLNSSCQAMSYATEECAQWDILLRMPNPSSRKKFFAGLVWASWVVLAATALIIVVAFNSFPEYEDDKSWEGSLRSLSNLCCCGTVLDEAVALDASTTASAEIAKTLNMLFGGIDLDPSDRLFAAMLVAELQADRRRQHVERQLEEAGYVARRSKSGAYIKRRRRQAAVCVPPDAVARGMGAPQSAAVRSLGSTAASAEPSTLARAGSDAWTAAGGGTSQAPPSVGSLDAAGGPQLGVLPMYRHELLALGTRSDADLGLKWGWVRYRPRRGSGEAEGVPGPAGSEASSQRGASRVSSRLLRPARALASTGRWLVDGAADAFLGGSGARKGRRRALLEDGSRPGEEGPNSLDVSQCIDEEQDEDLPAPPDAQHSSRRWTEGPLSPDVSTRSVRFDPDLRPASSGVVERSLSSRGGAATSAPRSEASAEAGLSEPPALLRVVDRYHPMLTPTGLPRRLLRLVSARAAASVYTGHQPSVSAVELRVTQAMSRHAVAAYGLQAALWARGQRPPACLGNANLALRCASAPCRGSLQRSLRARNLEAVAAITEASREDILRVSYANVPGGPLPYLIVRDAGTRSVVISLRGTVSMEDLITDLLSQPVEVSDWMPAWVKAANQSGEPMYAHAGVLSAATAVLRELEQLGVLKELLVAELRRHPDRGSLARGSSKAILSRDLGAPASVAASREAGFADGLPERARSEGPERAPPAPEAPGEDRKLARAIREALARPGWKVVVTGHSLGAAVACMLSFHLRERSDAVQCWAFCPPGGLMSWNLSRIAASFCTSVVVGKDVISRLSLNNLKRIVDEMVLALARCRRPKLLVMFDHLLKRRGGNRVAPRTFCDLGDISDEAVLALHQYHRLSYLHTADQPEMYPPGRIIFMRPFKNAADTEWDAVWVDAATLMGEGILLAPSMLSSHRMFNLADAFASIFEQCDDEEPGTPQADRV